MSIARPVRQLAGHQARWSRIELDVRLQAEGGERGIVAAPIELYALAEPERSIDAAALLRERVIADPPYWAIVWTGARAVAAVVTAMGLPPQTRVLDLGCGLGAAGIAAARRGYAVTFGDYLPEPLDFVRASLEAHGLDGCDVRRIDFTSDEDDGSRFDLVLAADIVYDPAHYAPLARYLDVHLATAGAILLTESLRADASVFLDGMRERGFADERSALWVFEDGRRERTWLHRLQRG